MLQENLDILEKEHYSPDTGFPTTERTIDAVVLILENTCMFADLHLHLPDMSYKILTTKSSWRSHIDRALSLTAHFVATIFDDKSSQLIGLYEQEIDLTKRTEDYINPYASKDATGTVQKKRKERKKLQRGPQLSSGKVEL